MNKDVIVGNKDVIVGCLYRHFKGALYRVEDIAINSETDKFMVVYRGLNGGMAWVRPFDMFCENVEVDGKTVPRFELVEADSKTESVENMQRSCEIVTNQITASYLKSCGLRKRGGWMNMTLEQANEKLKPCPFCGSEAKLVKTQLDEYKIFCLNDRCDASYGWCVNQKRAVEGWNRRAGEAE